MDKFLGLDSKFYKIGTWLGDMAVLVFLWFLCSIPLFTFGASTTAVYYVTTRQLSQKEGYISGDFFKSFKTNFITATAVTVLFLCMFYAEYINISNMSKSSIVYPLQFFVVYELTATLCFAFPLLSRFDFKFWKLLSMSFMMANRHFLTSFTCVLFLFVFVYFMYVITAPFYIYPIFMMVFMAAYAPLTSMMFMKVFRKYEPTLDVDKEDNFSVEE
ncbi:MAG TPA: hypothetical protein DCG28_03930 [Lachnospiraceae bacterium]|nr:hypothetical protein [Lachnospiraceae bacterium]